MPSSTTTRRGSPAAQGSFCLALGNLRGPSDAGVDLHPLDRVRNTRTGDLVCTVSARLTQPEADALAALAKRNGCSKASLMRELLRDGLKPLLEG